MISDLTVIDLYSGLGGWAEGFKREGFTVYGYDIEDFSRFYPGIFTRADLLNFSVFPHADVVVASPPCTEFSRSSLPPTWACNRVEADIPGALRLYHRAFAIIRMVRPAYYVVENVRGSQRYVGKADFHIGSRYFWTNVEPFQLDSDDIYGKTKLGPSIDRPALRSKIPLSISTAFAEIIKEKLRGN